jgi:hypothetical protein
VMSVSKRTQGKTIATRRLVDKFIASEITGLSPRTLDKRRFLGLPPAWYKVGRAARYDVAELDSFLAGQRRG